MIVLFLLLFLKYNLKEKNPKQTQAKVNKKRKKNEKI